MLKTRLISAAVGVVILLAILISGNAMLINAGVAGVIIFSLCELYMAFGFFKKRFLGIAGLFLPIFMIFGRFFWQNKFEYMQILAFFYVLLLFVMLILDHKNIKLKDIAVMFSLTFVISWFFSYIPLIRQMENGKALIWMVFIGAWLTDSGAYFTGMLCGRHKLCPEISPKKTVEGAIGGWTACVLSFLVYGFIVSRFMPQVNPNYLSLAVLGALCGIVAQIGDLSMSALKRDVNIKDFGNIMPGHGGVLDRFDSILFVAPLVYLYISYFPTI